MSANSFGENNAVNNNNNKELNHARKNREDENEGDEDDADTLFDPSMFDWGLDPSTGTNGDVIRPRHSYAFHEMPAFLADSSGTSTPRSGEDSVKSKQFAVNDEMNKGIKEYQDGNVTQSTSGTNVEAEIADGNTFVSHDSSKISSRQTVSFQALSQQTGCYTLLHPFAIQSSASCPTLNSVQLLPDGNTTANSALTVNAAVQVSEAQHHALAAYFLSQQHQFPLPANGPLHKQSEQTEVPNTSFASLASQPEIVNKSSKDGGSYTGHSVDPSKLPPFLLFGAPIELRENFIQAQRAHGIRPLDDNNSAHYGLVTANDFRVHNVRRDPVPSASLAANGIRLIDGRHGNVGCKRMRNAREQKRSQKINDLIDQLREKMERSGWRVGLKSKFHTLSSCADFVKHLIKLNKEKESSLQKAKEDFQAVQKKQKVEKDSRQEPSDPESTASSLTVSSSARNGKCASHVKTDDGVKKQLSSLDSNDSIEEKNKTKKSMLTSHESSVSSASSSGINDGISNDKKLDKSMRSVAVDQNAGSSLSDMTDSNKGHSRGISCEANSSVTSDAAVARGFDNRSGSQDHSDVVIKVRKRKALAENVSLSSQSECPLDYEEVFMRSNIPQIVSATSGKIIAYNDFFLKATGLTDSEVDRLTIFGLVRPDKLSSMFEIVASVLRSTASDNDEINCDGNADARNSIALSENIDFSAVILPCTRFRSLPLGANGTLVARQMYITITLMPDEDPQKRCFHCILTDSPNKDGRVGTVSPELLSLLFQKTKSGASSLSVSKPTRVPPKKRRKRHVDTN